MEPHTHRETARQLADDLAWLEAHCRTQPELADHAAHLRLAAALTRNVIAPSANGQPAKPLFVAVVGGAGTGKSTVVNFLCGSVVADANPQAGYTRHPTAFVPTALLSPWPSHLGFLGPLQRLGDDTPANLDEDVYQVKRIPTPTGSDVATDFVVWDCPDMTTWASAGYISRLMEVIALADVVVYVASDERYNDAVPTQFLHLIVRAGKAVVCCLTKMREADADPLVAHFRHEVLGRLPTPTGDIPPIPVVTIPHIPLAARNDPSGLGAKFRLPLLNQLLALCPSPGDARRRTLANAVNYLEEAGAGLLEVARRDLDELDTWRAFVAVGKRQFEERYHNEFLVGEAFRRFDATREQVLHMLELPGPGRFVGGVFAVLRWPFQFLATAAGKTLARPAPPNLSEQAVCTTAMDDWLNMLQAECLRRTNTHPVWKHLTHAFDAGLRTQARDQFAQNLVAFERTQTHEMDRTAREVPEWLANNPQVLTLMRLLVLALDTVVVVVFLWVLWFPQWYHFLILPVALGLTRLLVEFVVRQLVDAGRHRVREQREQLLAEHLTGPVAMWLTARPTSGGSSLEKLQLVLRRVPEAIRSLAELTRPATPPEPPVSGESPGLTRPAAPAAGSSSEAP